MHTREPAVAGMFYPANADVLRSDIIELLSNASTEVTPRPRAIIAPHAGYIYSGKVAAEAYGVLRHYANDIHRVVLLGPSHRVPVRGIAYCSADFYNTPLGRVEIDKEAQDILISNTSIHLKDEAHAQEHSLEVHVPFLQVVLNNFKLIPLVVGETDPVDLQSIFDTFWNDKHTLFVISSDLSHFHEYSIAKSMDKRTASIIESLDPFALTYEDACGRNPVNGLLYAARQHNLVPSTVSLMNSGDTAGDKSRVVGYGAFHFIEP